MQDNEKKQPLLPLAHAAGRISHREQWWADLRKGEEGKVGIGWGEEEVERGRLLRRKGRREARG
jgi:hypothetical protein